MACFGVRAARPLIGAFGAFTAAPLIDKHRRSVHCEAKKTWKTAQCVSNVAHTHDTRLITLDLGDSNWTGKGPIANVAVRAELGTKAAEGVCACCKCPPPCMCPKQANGCCACCKCDGTCGCPKQAPPAPAPAAAPEEGTCACCKCPPPCMCPKQANGCCACCKCDGTCGCPKQASPAPTPAATPEEGTCACCKCPPPCMCPKQANGCCACCKCDGTCGCPKKEAPASKAAIKAGPSLVARPYNPLSSDSGKTVTLLVKKYENSKMGSKLHSLEVGKTVEVRGPNQQWKFEKGKYSHYAMIAGGTGITPLFQATGHILKHDKAACVTILTLNKTESDTLLKGDLAELKKKYAGRLRVVHKEGMPTAEMLYDVLPGPWMSIPGPLLVMVCGRKEMTATVAGDKAPDFTQGELGGLLKELGYKPEQVWKV